MEFCHGQIGGKNLVLWLGIHVDVVTDVASKFGCIVPGGLSEMQAEI
jgi:hypothetical protein